MKKWAHAEALPIVSAGRSIGGMTNHASPRSTTNRHAHDPQVSGAPLAASFAQPHEETGPRGSAAHLVFWGGRRSIGGTADQASLGSESNCRATQGTGKPFTASFVHPAAGPLVEEAVRAQGHRGAAPYGVEEAKRAGGGRESEDFASNDEEEEVSFNEEADSEANQPND
jgi:hypothetical protein